MPTEPSFTVLTRGMGKPDYSSEISLGRIRPGLTLKYRQSLKMFGVSFSAILTPYPHVMAPLPTNGTHTAVANPTVMTDAAATFVPPIPPLARGLVGMTIYNITDGSSGTIIANTVNTVTVAALAGGATNQWNLNDVYAIIAHLIDWETGLSLPYTVPAGYTYTSVNLNYSFNQDNVRRTYFDGFFVGYLGTITAGEQLSYSEVVAFSTAMIDPTAATAHIYDVEVENLGGADMMGTMTIAAIMEAVGTEPLRGPTKRVRCKWCGHEWEVPQETGPVNCPSCGELNIYFTLAHIREF